MHTPSHIGRIPQKISSIGSSFTADQWRNWVCIYALYSLHGILRTADYKCMKLFTRACCLLLQPAISQEDLNIADNLLLQFCFNFK